MVGHPATLNAHLDQRVQLAGVREPQPDAHGSHSGPAATLAAVERNLPAVGLIGLQPHGILHTSTTYGESGRVKGQSHQNKRPGENKTKQTPKFL